jgi:hypothetical protein
MSDLKRYFDALFELRVVARVVPFTAMSFVNGEKPELAHCHKNVDRWIAEHPTDTPIRGWLILSESEIACCFAAHSIIKSASGNAFDITPVIGERYARFLRHPGTEEEFWQFRGARFCQVWWPEIR